MNRDSKNINSNHRGKIDTLKTNMRFSTTPFDGVGYPFRQALKELQQEGINIAYDRKMCRYYNKQTVSEIWGYN